MQHSYLPALATAFFKLDMPVLRSVCKDSALAQVRRGRIESYESLR
jgi:hypothetical protein